MKICTKCKIEKDYSFFGKRSKSKDGYSYICKLCKAMMDKEYSENNKEKIKKYIKEYYEQNKDKLIDRSREYYSENIENIKIRNKDYYEQNKDKLIEKSKDYYTEKKEFILSKRKINYNNNPEYFKNKSKKWRNENIEKSKITSKLYRDNNKEKIKECKRKYYIENKEKINKYMRLYWKDRKYIKSWRGILYRYFKFFNIEKKSDTLTSLGYTPEMLKMRIECQFKEGMSWENYGEWEIDHKKPLSKFSKNSKPSTVNALCNLQPLWENDNRSKSNIWK